MAKRHKVYKALTGVHEGKIGTYMNTDVDGHIVLKFDEDNVRAYLPTDVEELETLDLTPSWPGVLNIYLAVLENEYATREGRQAALDGLRQMAQVAQMYVDLDNKGLPAAIQLEHTDLNQYGDEHVLILNFPDGQTKRIRLYYDGDDESIKKLFTEEPELGGPFNKNKLYTK